MMKIGIESFFDAPKAPGQDIASINLSDGSLSISSVESSPPNTDAELARKMDNLLSAKGMYLPITSDIKPEVNGLYLIENVDVRFNNFRGTRILTWGLSAERFGSTSEAEMSTGVYPIERANAHSVNGTAWYSPSADAEALIAGPTEPSLVLRTGEDGPVPVYFTLSRGSLRWTVAPEDLYASAVTLSDTKGQLQGDTHSLTVDGWELSNGLVRVRPTVGLLEVAAFDGSWKAETFTPRVAGQDLTGDWSAATVIRNTAAEATVRLTRPSPTGVSRVAIDLTLRRGSRFVQGFIRTFGSSTIAVDGPTASTTKQSAGFIARSSNDPDGNRWFLGSAKNFSTNTTAGRIEVATATELDFYCGTLLNYSSPATAESGSEIAAQYIGLPSFTERAVSR